MVYWCYFLNSWNAKVIKNIEDKKVITFPVKSTIVAGNIIFIYILQGTVSGFTGYIRASDNSKNNLDDDNKYKYKIFDDRTLNKFVVNVKYCKILTRKIKKKCIFGEEKKFVTEFGKYLRNHKYLVNISDDLGKIIRLYIKNYVNSDNTSNLINSDTTSEISNETNQNEIKQVQIKKSRYIIPIIITPCEEFYKEIKTINNDDKIQWILEHITRCHVCDITNNNERVSLDIIYDKIVVYYKMTDDNKITTLLESYHALDFYKTKNLKENCMKIIKICNKDNIYHKCYCIVGKMDCQM